MIGPLSVVVTIVEGGPALERCLAALVAQERPPPALEIIVPWDDSIPAVPGLAGRFPSVRFLPLGRLQTGRPPASPAGQHELHDRRRAAGLAAARGRYVALLEDRAAPRPDWARLLVALQERHGVAAVGGAIEPAVATPLAWALYFADFGAYQNPIPEGPADELSDVNVCYRRDALERIRATWVERYHETSVHLALRQLGETLWRSPEPVVDQGLRTAWSAALLAQRRDWGRLYASVRAREATLPRRVGLTLGAPLLPLVLLVRHGRARYRRRATIGRFWRAVPALLVLLLAWSWGELLGYATGRE